MVMKSIGECHRSGTRSWIMIGMSRRISRGCWIDSCVEYFMATSGTVSYPPGAGAFLNVRSGCFGWHGMFLAVFSEPDIIVILSTMAVIVLN